MHGPYLLGPSSLSNWTCSAFQANPDSAGGIRGAVCFGERMFNSLIPSSFQHEQSFQIDVSLEASFVMIDVIVTAPNFTHGFHGLRVIADEVSRCRSSDCLQLILMITNAPQTTRPRHSAYSRKLSLNRVALLQKWLVHHERLSGAEDPNHGLTHTCGTSPEIATGPPIAV